MPVRATQTGSSSRILLIIGQRPQTLLVHAAFWHWRVVQGIRGHIAHRAVVAGQRVRPLHSSLAATDQSCLVPRRRSARAPHSLPACFGGTVTRLVGHRVHAAMLRTPRDLPSHANLKCNARATQREAVATTATDARPKA